MFDFLKTEKNLERFGAILYYGGRVLVLVVVIGAILGFFAFFQLGL